MADPSPEHLHAKSFRLRKRSRHCADTLPDRLHPKVEVVDPIRHHLDRDQLAENSARAAVTRTTEGKCPAPKRTRLRREVARWIELVRTLEHRWVEMVACDDDQNFVALANPVARELEISIGDTDDRGAGRG